MSLSAGVKLDAGLVLKEVDAARSEIARTLAFEALEVSTEEIQQMGAVDTGAMRASGYVETHGSGVPAEADAAARARGEAAGREYVPEEAGEAKVAYGAEYAELVHEGYGSNAEHGPRTFLKNAEKDVAARAIAEDIVKRRFGG